MSSTQDFNSFISSLSDKLNMELPGRDSQLKMSNSLYKQDVSIPDNHRTAAVLCLFFPSEENHIHFILMKRVSHIEDDPHAGQISFPGGSEEAQDKDLSDTAMRETHEEVGVIKNDISILGKLTQLYIPVSNFLVSPYVGYIDYEPKVNPQLEEVHSLLFPKLESFIREDVIKTTDIKVRNMELKDIPYFELETEIVWGATAMMLNELRDIILR